MKKHNEYIHPGIRKLEKTFKNDLPDLKIIKLRNKIQDILTKCNI